MNMTDEERDKFAAETALHKGVDVDKLLAMPADSYSGILKNADELVRKASIEDIPTFF